MLIARNELRRRHRHRLAALLLRWRSADCSPPAEPRSTASTRRSERCGGRLPGRELRLKQGEPVRVRLVNALEQPTSIHWHGIRLRNDADGVPGFTQEPVAVGDEFVCVHAVPDYSGGGGAS